MGAYDAIRKLGLSIPNDVAVVGFDNMEIIASQFHPALTTIGYLTMKWDNGLFVN